MRRLTTGIRSKKRVVRRFRRCTNVIECRARLKRDSTRAEIRFGLSEKRTSPFKLLGGGSVQSTTGSRGVCISSSNAGYTVF